MTSVPRHPRVREARSFWRSRLVLLEEVPTLPSAGGGGAAAPGMLEFAAGGDLQRAITELTRSSPLLTYCVLVAAVAACLHRWSSRSWVSIGSPAPLAADGTTRENVLPIIVEVDDALDFHRLLVNIRDVLVEAYRWADYSWRAMLADAGFDERQGVRPLVDLAALSPALHGPLPEVGHGITVALASGGAFAGRLTYDTSRFEPLLVARFARHLVQFLDRALAAPQLPIGELEVLDAEERRWQLAVWNQPRRPAVEPPLVHHRFEERARETPTAVAVRDGARILTYRELDLATNRGAHLLRQAGVGPDVGVGLFLDRGLEAVVAILAVLKAGGACVPLDPAYPVQRLRLMAEDARVAVVVTGERLAAQVPTPPEVPRIMLDAELERRARLPEETPASGVGRENLVYVLFTSGSTGRPKGVGLVHRVLAGLVEWQCGEPDSAAGRSTLQFAPLSFDVAFQEIFATLGAGGCLVLVTEEERRDPRRLFALLARTGVERLFLPFTALRLLSEAAAESDTELPRLRTVVTAGEQLQITSPLVRLFERLPGCTLQNQYGPTESHVVSSHTLVGPPREWIPLPPIGRPIDTARLYLLDGSLRLLPRGAVGEIHIGGGCLARGYVGRPDLSAERFVPDPWSEQPGARLYRTGDLGRFRPDGTLEFLGRVDDQVKVRGYRVELGEIETALGEHPAVQQAAVVALDSGSGRGRLTACLVPSPGGLPAVAELRGFLLERLPEPLVPVAYVALERLPMTPSGKVDRRALAAVTAGRELGEFAPPRDPVEQVIAAIWSQLLGGERIGVHDNFFALGGHSLLGTQILARVLDRFGVEVPLAQLFQGPTVAELAAAVRELVSPSATADPLLVGGRAGS